MTSSRKQKDSEQKFKLRRAKQLADLAICPRHHEGELPSGAVLTDQEKLDHVNTYDVLPKFYIDQVFTCRDCGIEEVWTADQQKWFYEEAKGHIDARAVRCRQCRDAEKKRKDEARKVHLEGRLP